MAASPALERSKAANIERPLPLPYLTSMAQTDIFCLQYPIQKLLRPFKSRPLLANNSASGVVVSVTSRCCSINFSSSSSRLLLSKISETTMFNTFENLILSLLVLVLQLHSGKEGILSSSCSSCSSLT
jgi:hypothetical protein